MGMMAEKKREMRVMWGRCYGIDLAVWNVLRYK